MISGWITPSSLHYFSVHHICCFMVTSWLLCCSVLTVSFCRRFQIHRSPLFEALWRWQAKHGSSAWNGVLFWNAEQRCVSRLVRDRPPLFCREKQPPTHHPIWSSFQKPFFAKFETPKILRRRQTAANLTCGLLVAWLSVLASFGVGSVVWRKRICGAGATLGASREIAIVHCWLFVVWALGTRPSSLDWTQIVGPVLVHFVH